jgi:hypothetical protein
MLQFVAIWLGQTQRPIMAQEHTGPDQASFAYQVVASTVPAAAPEFGLAFINSAENPSSSARIQRGLESGAEMDRFPLYWDRIETGYGVFNWASQDAALRANESAGLNTLAILLGTPGHYARSTPNAPVPTLGGSLLRYSSEVSSQSSCERTQGPPAPAGLFNPIFVDGGDEPGVNKSINPDNYWARFVHAAVNRYRPGGSAGLHVRHWEIWNEPDLCHFWSGTPQEYARLLKVAYLVIKQSDPDAIVLWGGLAHFANAQFLPDLIESLRNDPMAAAHGGYFDAAASHHYSLSWNSFDYTSRVRRALDNAGWTNKPIWITESGVPVCNDYPGPACPSDWRATPQEQAAYIWQNIAYTKLGGGGPIFHFMLHDDCGNEVRPDSPDGFGIAKNEASSYCSPANAEKRPAFKAYQLAVQYFTDTLLAWADITQNRTVRRVAFYHSGSQERRLLLWSIVDQEATALVPAISESARLIALDGTETPLFPNDGVYTIRLPGATNRNWPNTQNGYDIGIYGAPYLLIDHDTLPPSTHLDPLPATVGPSIPIRWQAQDWGSGVASTELWWRMDGGDWQLWQADLPAVGELHFPGAVDHHYQFSLLATDRAGNAHKALVVQAETTVRDKVEVQGSVVDLRGLPVVGIEVMIGGVTTQTNQEGKFSLLVPIGSWDILVAGKTVNRGRSFMGQAQLLLLHSSLPNVVQNGDFEAGLAGWQWSGSSPLAVQQQENTSDHALRLGASFVPNPGVPGEDGSNGGNSTIVQSIMIPDGHPYLAFAYKVESQETASGHDKFEVILAADGEAANYVFVQGTASDWRYRFIELSAYQGRSLQLIFNLYQSSALRPSSVLLDMITLSDAGAQNYELDNAVYLPVVVR